MGSRVRSLKFILLFLSVIFVASCKENPPKAKVIDPNFIQMMDSDNGKQLVSQFTTRQFPRTSRQPTPSSLAAGAIIPLGNIPKTYKNALQEVLLKKKTLIIISSTSSGCNNCSGLYEYLITYLKSTSTDTGVIFFELDPAASSNEEFKSIKKDGKVWVVKTNTNTPIFKWSQGTPTTVVAKNGKYVHSFINTSYVINEDELKTTRRNFLVQAYKDILTSIGN